MSGSSSLGRRLPLFVAWAIYVVAWTVPVYSGGDTLPRGLPGWDAFKVAMTPELGLNAAQLWWAAVSVASGLTNLLMLASPLILLPRYARWRERLAYTALIALLLNGHWLVMLADNGPELMIGYFLWWGSFPLMGLGALLSTRGSRPEGVTP